MGGCAVGVHAQLCVRGQPWCCLSPATGLPLARVLALGHAVPGPNGPGPGWPGDTVARIWETGAHVKPGVIPTLGNLNAA